jgi:hypothetical protein
MGQRLERCLPQPANDIVSSGICRCGVRHKASNANQDAAILKVKATASLILSVVRGPALRGESAVARDIFVQLIADFAQRSPHSDQAEANALSVIGGCRGQGDDLPVAAFMSGCRHFYLERKQAS